MNRTLAISKRQQRAYLFSGVVIFISGLIYYAVFREHLPWPGYLLNLEGTHKAGLLDVSMGTYPSFAFALTFSFIAIAIFSHSRKFALTAIASVWVVGIAHESVLGTFDSLDVFAGTLASVFAFLLYEFSSSITAIENHIARIRNTNSGNAPLLTSKQALSESKSKHLTQSVVKHDRFKLLTLMLVSLTCATATSQYETGFDNCIDRDVNNVCVERRQSASPVYLSYADLRSAVTTEEPREMSSVSRIYLYKNYLFVNEQNEGIHVIDNSTPMTPENIAFISIPGNTEISIRSDNLYADSYIDLVTLDVSNINRITEVARQESIFPYNSRQNVSANVTFDEIIDSARGVVVGVR